MDKLIGMLFGEAKKNKIVGCAEVFLHPSIMMLLTEAKKLYTTEVGEKYVKRGDLILFLKERKTIDPMVVELRDLDFTKKVRIDSMV